MSAVETLPRWDMETVYPGPDSAELDRDFRSIVDDLKALSSKFDDYGVQKRDSVPMDDATIVAFEDVTERFSSLLERIRTISAYLACLVSADSRDERAQARSSMLDQEMVLFSQLDTRFTGWIGSLDVDELVGRSAVARQYSYILRRTKEEAHHLMSQSEEFLAAELNLTGGDAWSNMYGNVTSQLMVPIEIRGERQELPISVIRNLASEPDRETRRRAYEAELEGWKSVEVPVAQALNSIKGQSNTLNGHRQWESALDLALFNNSIDRPTLDAMMQAARDSFPEFRRYLKAKAAALGLPALEWYDLFAPVGEGGREWSFDEARGFVIEQLGTYTPQLSDFVARAFRERWIDAEPRPGKRGGAFCMPLRNDESRVLANFKPSYDGMSTLAHELGHAYHFHNLASRPILLRSTPMTLAETASIFCETLVQQAALERADRAEQIEILEAALQNACQIVVDISSRFMFEQNLFGARRGREQSVDELSAMMLDSQRETYGDGLASYHQYMWAAKGHYYSAGYPYYNFPYMFGYLFGVGLFALYRKDPEGFTRQYDELLGSTGEADAATLAQRFGIDVQSTGFWKGSLEVVREQIDRFEQLVGRS